MATLRPRFSLPLAAALVVPCLAVPSTLDAQAGTGAPSYTSISAGGRHTCALGADGTAYCWGSNQSGQLGNSIQVLNQELPNPVNTPQKFAAISAGGRHTCALATDGAAWCWGANGAGQLGTGTTTASRLPVAVAGGLRFRAISATDAGTCALTNEGRAYCWGSPSGGRLGAGDTATGRAPALVGGPLTFTDLTAGYAHTCAIAASGQGYCWGMNTDGRLGIGNTMPAWIPTRVVPSSP